VPHPPGNGHEKDARPRAVLSLFLQKKFHRRPVRTVRENLASFRAAAPVFQATEGKINITGPNGCRNPTNLILFQAGVGSGSNSQVYYRRL
jgi:hypothetical protein